MIGNAIKFTEEGSVRIRANVHPKTASDTEELEILVEDDGIGMDAATQSRIFDQFTQADASTTRRFGGTGLGLAITKQFVELMGGSISMDSVPMQGTSVAIRLPIARSAPSGNERRMDGLRVGVIGKDTIATSSISSHFSRFGASATSGESLELLTGDKLDLIVAPVSFMLSTKQRRFNHSDVEIRFYDDTCEFTSGDALAIPFTGEDILALEVPYDSQTQPTAPTLQPDQFDGTALVAEDIPVNQEIICRMLSQLGLSFVVAENGKEAIEAFENNLFDVVFMDCQMPEIDGYAATRQIREVEMALDRCRTPIIALTAGTSSAEIDQCIESGMDDFIGKPFTLEDLSDALQNVRDTGLKNLSIKLSNERRNTHSSSERSIEPSASRLIDEEVIRSLLALSQSESDGLIERLRHGYRDQLHEKLMALEAAIPAKDTNQCRVIAHAVKSMSANIGAATIRDRFAELEDLCRAGSVELDEDIVDWAKTESVLFDEELYAYMARGKST